MVLLMFTLSCRSENDIYTMHKFNNTKEGIQLVFRNASSMRMIVLNDESKTVFIKTSSFKGAFDWNKIITFKNIEGEFTAEFENKVIKFGKISSEDWIKFVSKYNSQFKIDKT
jgi:hypothetical protein